MSIYHGLANPRWRRLLVNMAFTGDPPPAGAQHLQLEQVFIQKGVGNLANPRRSSVVECRGVEWSGVEWL